MNQQQFTEFLRDSFVPEWRKCEHAVKQNPSYLQAIKQGLVEGGASLFPLVGPATLGFLTSLREQRQDNRIELIETILGLNDKERREVAEKIGISPHILDDIKKFYIITSENQRKKIVQVIEKLGVQLSQEHEIIRVKLEAIEQALHMTKVATSERANRLANISVTPDKIQDYNERIREFPSDATAYLQRGRAYFELGEYDKALRDFDTVVNIDKKISHAYYSRANVYKAQGKIDQALDDYTTTIKLDRKNYVALTKRGDLYTDTRQYKQAIEDYTKAIKADKTWWPAYLGRAIIYKRQKAYPQAIKDFTRTIKFEPDDSSLYALRGDIYYIKAKYKRALNDFTHAIALDPNDDFSYYQRGIIFGEQKLYDRAIQDLTESIRLDPNEPLPYYRRAYIYEKKYECEKAVSDYSKAVQILVSERDYSHADLPLKRALKLTKKSGGQSISSRLQALLPTIEKDPRMRKKWSKKLRRHIASSKK